MNLLITLVLTKQMAEINLHHFYKIEFFVILTVLGDNLLLSCREVAFIIEINDKKFQKFQEHFTCTMYEPWPFL